MDKRKFRNRKLVLEKPKIQLVLMSEIKEIQRKMDLGFSSDRWDAYLLRSRDIGMEIGHEERLIEYILQLLMTP